MLPSVFGRNHTCWLYWINGLKVDSLLYIASDLAIYCWNRRSCSKEYLTWKKRQHLVFKECHPNVHTVIIYVLPGKGPSWLLPEVRLCPEPVLSQYSFVLGTECKGKHVHYK